MSTVSVADEAGARGLTPRRYQPEPPATRAATVGVIWLIVLGNVGVIVWLWARGGGVSGVRSPGDLWTSVGRVTGLLCAYLALLQVLLLARLPWLERISGFDRLTVWHRLNGKLCLALVLAHVVFITIGYAAMDRITIPPEVGRLLASYPGMVAATLGTVLLVVVVLTSLVIVRQRLRYEAWYVVHLSAYAGIALAWVHQIPTGNELSINHAATYWTALYLATLMLLLLFRLVQPLWGVWWYGLRVRDVTVEGPGVVSLHITGRHLDRLGACAGQFFLWRFLTPGRWWASHPFSLSAAPDGTSLRITVKNTGDFTSRIGAIPPGTRVIAEGPFGRFTAAVRRYERVAFIAGGIGITPIRAMLEEMSGDMALVYRVVREDDLVFRAELDRLAAEQDITVFYVVGDHADPANAHLLSAEHLRQLLPDIAEREVYLCGPPAMMRAAEATLRRVGVPRQALHSERFALAA